MASFDPVNITSAFKLLDAQSRRSIESVDVLKEKLAHVEGLSVSVVRLVCIGLYMPLEEKDCLAVAILAIESSIKIMRGMCRYGMFADRPR